MKDCRCDACKQIGCECPKGYSSSAGWCETCQVPTARVAPKCVDNVLYRVECGAKIETGP